MSAKHIGLALCAGGVACFVGAYCMDSKSSFEDGSFIGQILLAVAGAALFVAGLLVAIFG